MKHLVLYVGLFLLALPVSCTSQSSLDAQTTRAELNTSVAGTIIKRADKTAEFFLEKKSTASPTAIATEKNTPISTTSPSSTGTNPEPSAAIPSQTPTPSQTGISPHSPATISPTISSPAVEQYLQIFAPGESSRVTSPILLQAKIASESGRLLRIELRGQDGRLLSRLVKVSNVFPWHTADISLPVVYEINLPEEEGYLSISLEDETGRTVALNSVKVILQKEGGADIRPNDPDSAIIIQSPSKGTIIKGEILKLNGKLVGDIQVPVYVKLITNNGSILAHRQADVVQNGNENNRQFSAQVPFLVTSRTPILMVVYASEGNADEISHLSSMEIILIP